MTCRVFGLDAASGEIEEYSSYYPASRLFLGRVVNALDGEPLADVTITATDYLGMSDAILTEPDGGFIFPVEIGEYKLEFSKDGFIGSSFQIRMGADETPREIRCALSPQVQEYRIVLTWQQNPSDLDAHLSGPHPQGGDFHIWYRNKVLIDGRDFLDRDDLDGYGPETITVYKPASGTYRYAVHDYTNKSKTRSSSLSNSGAMVQIYGANRLLGSFTVPPGQPGNCWYVFEIDSQQKIKATNFVDYIAEERNIW
ncbi:MAG: carboxypeptidase regulatory-like domain-containing protein [Candidatus Cloacimonetes bacterium]|nr:carboxypeptidase regulatory-like domain-containing protein [Candidatus Cloacimonadota bacterium]